MTENEALKEIERHIQFLRDNWKPHPDYNVMEALREALSSIEEIQKYRAIGTVEECEKYKRGCIVGVVKVDKEQLQSIVDEKVKDIELDIKKIRNCAIDEFLENISKELQNLKQVAKKKEDMYKGYPVIYNVSDLWKRTVNDYGSIEIMIKAVSEKMKEVEHGKTETKSPTGA